MSAAITAPPFLRDSDASQISDMNADTIRVSALDSDVRCRGRTSCGEAELEFFELIDLAEAKASAYYAPVKP